MLLLFPKPALFQPPDAEFLRGHALWPSWNARYPFLEGSLPHQGHRRTVRPPNHAMRRGLMDAELRLPTPAPTGLAFQQRDRLRRIWSQLQIGMKMGGQHTSHEFTWLPVAPSIVRTYQDPSAQTENELEPCPLHFPPSYAQVGIAPSVSQEFDPSVQVGWLEVGT